MPKRTTQRKTDTLSSTIAAATAATGQKSPNPSPEQQMGAEDESPADASRSGTKDDVAVKTPKKRSRKSE